MDDKELYEKIKEELKAELKAEIIKAKNEEIIISLVHKQKLLQKEMDNLYTEHIEKIDKKKDLNAYNYYQTQNISLQEYSLIRNRLDAEQSVYLNKNYKLCEEYKECSNEIKKLTVASPIVNS